MDAHELPVRQLLYEVLQAIQHDNRGLCIRQMNLDVFAPSLHIYNLADLNIDSPVIGLEVQGGLSCLGRECRLHFQMFAQFFAGSLEFLETERLRQIIHSSQSVYSMSGTAGSWNALFDGKSFIAAFKAPSNISSFIVSAPSLSSGYKGVSVSGKEKYGGIWAVDGISGGSAVSISN